MAVKTYTKEEQAVIDAKTKSVAKAGRNKKLMYILGAVVVVGATVYFMKKRK